MTQKKFGRVNERGIALVLTLAILVIATILVIAFTSSMRTERQAAASMANNMTTEIIAQSALNHAISVLDKNIPQPLGPNVVPAAQNWAINPGQLVTVSGVTTNIIPLYSGAAIGGTDPNLNQLKLDGTNYEVLGNNAAPMKVAWVNCLKDSSQAGSATNPLIGRYAFWIDDENNKINLNTAFGKPFPSPFPTPTPVPGNTNGRYTRGSPPFTISGTIYTLGHPTSVELAIFSGLNAAAMRAATSIRPLTSTEDVKEFVASNPQAFYEANKFSLTTFNADPEFNAFGKSRIFFADSMFYPTDYTDTTTSNPYWDTGYAYRSEPTTPGAVTDPSEPLILHAQLMNDWGSAGYDKAGGTPSSDSTASNPVAAAVQRIAGYLNTTWPGYSQSFVAKYGIREAEQIAWNIYGMGEASTIPHTTTTEGAWANTTYRKTYGPPNNMRWSSFLWDGSLGSGARILPQTRTPLITKVGIGLHVSQRGTGTGIPYMLDPAANNSSIKGTTKYGVNFTLAFEFHLPSGYQGFHSVSSGTGVGWSLNNDRIYAVHLEATINGTKVVLASTMDKSAMSYDANGSDTKMVITSTSSSLKLDPNASPDGDRKVNALGSNGDLSTGDPASSGNSTYVVRLWDSTSTPTATISDIRIRFVATTPSTNSGSSTTWDRIPYQISPIRDIDAAPGFEPGNEADPDPTKHGSIHFPGSITIDSALGYQGLGGPSFWAVMETTDPRVNQLDADWRQSGGANYGTLAGNTVLGTRTLPTYPASSVDGDESKLAFPDNSQFTISGGFPVHRGGRPHDTDKRMSSVGWLSCVSTGIQSGRPWRTLKFQPGGGGDPPDWLLMDLFAVPFDEQTRIYTNSTYQYPIINDTINNRQFSAVGLPFALTYMNSTAGKININAKVFPDKSTDPNFTTPDRTLPLQALLENMYRGTTQITSSAATAGNNSKTLALNIVNQVPAPGRTFNGPYKYGGEICEVAGIADDAALNEWDRESVIRNLGSLITTRSNAFGVWGIAQSVKKVPQNVTGPSANPAQFQSGDQVVGEKRFYAIVERYIWPGMDGVAGNAEIDSSGSYSQLGANAFLASPTNTNDGTDPSSSSFEQSYNPQAAVIKYRVRSFRYLDD